MSIARIASEHGAPSRGATTDGAWRGLAPWVALVVIGVLWGTAQVASDDQGLHAAPFVGRWRWELDGRLLPALVFGAAVVAAGPRVARAVAWRPLVIGAGLTATVWAALLAARDGWATPFDRPSEYLRIAVAIDSPRDFLHTFATLAPDYPTHVKGHPPGATLAFWLLDRVGLRGAGWAAVMVVVAWGIAVAAVVAALAAVAGRDAARRAAPFVALSPAAVWAGFSADALFAATIATGIALVIVATGQRAARATAMAAVGGAVLGLSLHLTYGAVPLLVVPAVAIIHRRRFDLVVPAALGAALVTAAFLSAGFWWLDGLAVTHQEYWDGVAARRPWPYHLLAGNPAALALAAGPAVAAGLGRLRLGDTSAWLVPVAALVAVAIANVSGLSKGEVERIWLPFVPWLLTASVLVPVGRQRTWLAAQAGVALVLQAVLRSPW